MRNSRNRGMKPLSVGVSLPTLMMADQKGVFLWKRDTFSLMNMRDMVS